MDERGLAEFEMRWSRRAAAPYVTLTPDERRSIVFLLPERAPWYVTRWLVRCDQLEQFVRNNRRMPHRTRAEASLYDWVRVQRRTRWSLTEYQRERLELVLGPAAWGRADAWERSLYEYEELLDRIGRVPRRRSLDPTEARLARWWERTLTQRAGGRLPGWRTNGLAALERKRARVEQSPAGDGRSVQGVYETTPLPFDFEDEDFFLDIEVARSAALNESDWISDAEDWNGKLHYLSEQEPLTLAWTQMWLIRDWRDADLIDVSSHYLGGAMQHALPLLAGPELRRLIDEGPGRDVADLMVIDAVHVDPRIARRGYGTQLLNRTLELIPSLAPALVVTIPESVNTYNPRDPDSDVRFWLEHIGATHVGQGVLIDIYDPARSAAVAEWKTRVSVPFTDADRDELEPAASQHD